MANQNFYINIAIKPKFQIEDSFVLLVLTLLSILAAIKSKPHSPLGPVDHVGIADMAIPKVLEQMSTQTSFQICKHYERVLW